MKPEFTPRRLPQLLTPRLVLRLATSADAPRLAEYFVRTREAFRSFEPARLPEYYTESFWYEQAKRSVEEFVRDQNARFFIFTPAGMPIGSVNFNQIVRGNFQGCTLAYALDPEKQGQWLMHESLSVLIPYAFEELGLHRIMAGYMPHNARSAAVLKRLGFEIEGKARDYIRIDGEWRDHILTSLVNDAWRA